MTLRPPRNRAQRHISITRPKTHSPQSTGLFLLLLLAFPAILPAQAPLKGKTSEVNVSSLDEVQGQNTGSQAADRLSLEELLDVKVTSAGQKEQKLSDVASAIAVINADEIRRSGATTIPDLLRYVPGVEVSQANNMDTSVAIRGFGGIFSSKLLVLVDGRSIYNPIYAGVDWGFQRMMMENIERVEIIRGPGATVWGANAVNGVINIITKDARDMQGGFVSGSYGTKEQGAGSFRYGFQPTQDLNVALYGQYENIGASQPLQNVPGYDELQNGLIGFRADYRPSSDDHFRLSSEGWDTHAGNRWFGFAPTPAFTVKGDAQNANFIYEHTFDEGNQLTFQSYYDRFYRESDGVFSAGTVQTADVQIRHTLPLEIFSIKQELTYGAEYRFVDDKNGDTQTVTWLRDRHDQTFSLFVQTDLHLVEETLILTLGTKYDHNDYTGNEIQPSIKLLWKIDSKNTIWGSISRAVREPSIVNYEATLPGQIIGNQQLDSEDLTAFELGYRVEPIKEVSLDVAFFYNRYENLISAFILPGSVVPTFEQFQNAQTYGVEPSIKAQLQPWWRVSGSYSLLQFHTDNSGVPGGVIDPNIPLEKVDPQNQFSIRSSFDLPCDIDIDLGGRYVDNVGGAKSYFAMDLRVGWRPSANWEISLVGQNLLAGNHLENPNQFGNTTYVSPEVYGKVVFKF